MSLGGRTVSLGRFAFELFDRGPFGMGLSDGSFFGRAELLDTSFERD